MKIQNDVLISNDWFFLWQGAHSQFDYLLGNKEVSHHSISNYKKNIHKRTIFCTERNIPYLHVIFPSKPVVMADKLPDDIKNIQSLTVNFPNFGNVIYPLSELAKNERSFYKTDTHNTPTGSWIILKKIFHKFNIQDDEKKPIFKTSNFFNGDLSKMMNQSNKEHFLDFKGIENEINSKFDINNFNALNGNKGRIRIIRNPFSILKKRLLIFGDSFYNTNLIDQLSFFFSDIIFFRTPSFYYETIDYIKPDYILSGQAERYLSSIPNDNEYEFPFLCSLNPNFYNSNALNKKFYNAIMAQFNFSRKNILYNEWADSIDGALYRDYALTVEKDDFQKAVLFMTKALEKRPEGIIIKEKLKEYNKKTRRIK